MNTTPTFYWHLCLGIQIFYVAFIIGNEADDFIAVSSYDGVSGIDKVYKYQRMRQKPDKTSISQLEAITKLDTKKRICHNIINSGFFQLHKKDVVDTEEIYLELKTKYPGLMNELYVKSNDPQDERMIYTNHFRKIYVTLGSRTFEEFVFVCLARDHGSGQIEEYFVSRQYNVNEVSGWTRRYIRGRYIFEKLSNTKEAANFVVVAIAEQPASVLATDQANPILHSVTLRNRTVLKNQDSIHYRYLQARKNHKVEKNDWKDPLCGLVKFSKIRICSSVLNSSNFYGAIRYLPKSELIGDCEKKQVLLRKGFEVESDETITSYYRPDVVYEEWMLRCVAEADTDSPNEYFVSRAYNSNYAFVYVQDGSSGGVRLKNLSSDISVIEDN